MGGKKQEKKKEKATTTLLPQERCNESQKIINYPGQAGQSLPNYLFFPWPGEYLLYICASLVFSKSWGKKQNKKGGKKEKNNWY